MSDTRHRRISWTGEPDTCAVCGTEWPCDGNRADPDTGTDQTPTPDAIRERHQPVDVPYATGRQVCTLCLQRWPCDAIVALDDADRLAAALRHAPVVIGQTEQTAAWEVERRDALRQHKEASDG